MSLDLTAYKVANNETSDFNKFDNLLDALQTYINAISVPVASVLWQSGQFAWAGTRTLSGFLLCDASAVSRTTYANLFSAIVPSAGVFTVTVASPGVFTLTAHGFVIGDRVFLTTSGALPTGLAVNTIYYVVSTADANTFTLSATEGGSAINTSGTQSGVHTAHFCPYGLGDGSTTFNLPDSGGRGLIAAAGSSGSSVVRAQGQNDGVTLANRRGTKHKHTAHTHTLPGGGSFLTTATGTGPTLSGGSGLAQASLASVDGGSGTSTDPTDGGAMLVANLFIKT